MTIICGDALEELRKMPECSVHCCITSPPYYGLRDYGIAGQIGKGSTLEEYVTSLIQVFKEVRRVLRGDGTLWRGEVGNGTVWCAGVRTDRDDLSGTYY